MSGSITLPQHREYLAARAVPLELAEQRGARSVSHQQARARGFRGPRDHPLDGLLLPIHRPDGSRSAQLRLDVPILDREKPGKSRRYLNLPGQPAKGLDLHPSMRDRLSTPSVPKFLTEGVAKVDALTAAGYCGIGLVGVWMGVLKQQDGSYLLHPDLARVAQPGSILFLAFDSDQLQNRHVHAALRVTRDLLKARGCLVLVLQIPTAADGGKQGIDDYLAAGGSMPELIANATTELPPLEPGAAAERCRCTHCPFEQLARHNAAALGLVHTILSDRDKPMGARAAFLSVWLEARAHPARTWDYQPDLAGKVGMKSVNTFRTHLAPFIAGHDNPNGPIIKRFHRDEIPDETAPQGKRYVERVRYDLRTTDDQALLSSYLKVEIEPAERKTREKSDPATCEHPEMATEAAEVDRCTACEAVLKIRPLRVLKICVVGKGASSPVVPPMGPLQRTAQDLSSGVGGLANPFSDASENVEHAIPSECLRLLVDDPIYQQLDWGSKARWLASQQGGVGPRSEPG